jgi:drug/metabolite transporter (DMT)-like permease
MGLFFSFLSALFSTSKDLLSKRLAFRMDGTTSTFTSFAYALPYYAVALGVLYLLGEEQFTLTRSFLVLVLLRSVTDTFAEGMKMHAFSHGDISIVATFFSLSPLFMLIVMPLITADVPSVAEAAAVLLVVGGSVAMVYRPSSAHWAGQQRGILLATGASVFFALNSCFDRLAVREGTPVFAGFSMTLLSALFLLPFVVGRLDRVKVMRDHHGGLLVRGFLEIAFMVCKLYALKYMDPAKVASVQRLSLVLSIIGGRVFFKEPDFARRLAAGVLIVAGVLLITWMQLQSAR